MSANRGKEAEKKIKDFLEKLKSTTSLVYHRLPDTHSGSRVPTLADFLVGIGGEAALLEVKEVNHGYRLPYGNFEVENVSRMKMWRLAGFKTLVAVYFKPLKQWRMVSSDYFERRPLCSADGKPIGSWDMRDVQLSSVEYLRYCL